jgi:hypothetical protein
MCCILTFSLFRDKTLGRFKDIWRTQKESRVS